MPDLRVRCPNLYGLAQKNQRSHNSQASSWLGRAIMSG
jgi:hypothetical protein